MENENFKKLTSTADFFNETAERDGVCTPSLTFGVIRSQLKRYGRGKSPVRLVTQLCNAAFLVICSFPSSSLGMQSWKLQLPETWQARACRTGSQPGGWEPVPNLLVSSII